MMKNLTALIILDGFGYSENKENNAIALAKKPNLDFWFKNFPHTILQASGEFVGLPKGYIGNSEVGHMAIGAGRRIKQPLTVINEEIETGKFFENKILNENLQKLYELNGDLHLIGLLSDAGVHSHINHLLALIEAANKKKIKQIYLHLFLDGRDTNAQSAKKYLTNLQNFIAKFSNVKIGSIHGRFYAMDRDQNWDRTEKSYQVLTEKQNIKFENWNQIIDFYYKQNITDEFIPPTQLDENSIVKDNDGIICFNFRSERIRQLIECFTQKDFNIFQVKNLHLTFFITLIPFLQLKTIYLYELPVIKNSLMDIFAQNKLTTFSIAETEKYAHITYFIRCGRENPDEAETQILIPSIKTESYKNFSCMSAKEITQTVIHSIQTNPKDFYLINYANADMVGHSGDLQATIRAIECLDNELQKIYNEIVEKRNGTIYITADHGNAELMFDENSNQANNAHTTNPVPFIWIKNDLKGKNIKLDLKELADIAPFILKNLNLLIPEKMEKIK